MTTPSSTTKTTAKAVEEARKTLADRRAALNDAREKLSNAEKRAADTANSAGDTSFSTFTKAQEEADYWRSVAPNRERQLRAAERELARATAEHVTAQVTEDATNRWGLGRYADAKAHLIEAVQEAEAVLREYNTGRNEALHDLIDAGLNESDADPLAVAWARQRHLNRAAELHVAGEDIPEFDVRHALVSVVDGALAGATR